ncbi:MAG TPA: tetratricopeptide repeat protein, partial [Bacteroidia bacterium]
MRYTLIIIYLFIGSFVWCAPISREDSLLLKYKASKVDTDKFNIAIKLYNNKVRKGDYVPAKSFADTLLKLGKAIENQKFLSLAYQYRGNFYYKTNKFDSAQYYDYKGIETAEKVQYYPTLVKCYVNLGNICHQRADYPKALIAFQNAEQYSIKGKDTLARIIIKLNQGNVYYEINDYKQARENFSKVVKICSGLPQFKHELASGYNNLATVYLNDTPKRLDSAMYYYMQFLDLSKQLGSESNLALAYYNIAEVYRLTGKVKEARENYFKSRDIYTSEEDTLGLMKVCLGLGDNYVLENNPVEGLTILKQGLKYSNEYKMVSNKANFLKSISSAYYKMGNYKEAFDYFHEGSLLSDSIYNADNSKILYDLQTRYETTEKEKQNKLLEAENTISHKTIRQQQLVTYFIIGGLLLALAFAFFIFRGLRQQRKANVIIS